MDPVKVPIHSVTDLVTNSSTVIYTYSDGSLKILEEMIDEFFKAFNIDKKCKDVFGLYVTLSSPEDYIDRVDGDKCPEFENMDWKQQREYIQKTIQSVALGEIPEPIWLKELNSVRGRYDSYTPATTLYIFPKASEYENLAKLVSKFLYSTDHEASYGG